MSDPSGPAPSTDARLQASHDRRAKFEQLAYSAAIAIVLATAIILLFGIAYPPPAPDTKLADWGATIVSRARDAVPVLFTLLSALGVGTGITLTRGHMDARLDRGGDQ